ncbi:YD repeat domain protein [Burkholderia pseudomallei MSHR7527]|nr:YD repeat domain protein [Burkholderia pseudomallei MSHR7527]KGX54059.1 YD repeat domain protein [Burkholderia pseudomallei TSV44]
MIASTGSARSTLQRRKPGFRCSLSASALAQSLPRKALNSDEASAAMFMTGGPPTSTGRPTGIGSITELGIDSAVLCVCAPLCGGGSSPIDQQLIAGSAMNDIGSLLASTVLLPMYDSPSFEGSKSSGGGANDSPNGKCRPGT